MTKVYMKTENDLITLSWENINAYLPDEKKSFLSFLKRKNDEEIDKRRHIIQNGRL